MSIEETILSLEEDAMERWRHGDPMRWAEISAEDIIYVDPGLVKPVSGLVEYRTNLKEIVGKVNYEGSEFIAPRVVVIGNAAVLTYNYRSTLSLSDKNPQGQTLWNTTEVYFRRAGEWKIVHTHWSYVRHKPPQSVEVPVPVEAGVQKYEGVLREIMALETAAMQRWRKGDPWGFFELYSPEVTYFDTGTPQRIDGREAMRLELSQREGRIHFDVMEFIAPNVQVEGDVAVLFYRFFDTHLNPDGSIAARVPWNSTYVYARVEGTWRIIHNHWSFIKGERID